MQVLASLLSYLKKVGRIPIYGNLDRQSCNNFYFRLYRK